MNKPEYIDIHTHINFAAYDTDRAETIERSLSAGVWMINVGTQLDTSKEAVNLAQKYEEGVYATIGLHPIHTSKSHHDASELGSEQKGFTSRAEVFDFNTYRDLAKMPKVVAIGECGLDFYRLTDSTIELQIGAIKEQIRLANEVNKPLMLHIRSGSGRSAYMDAYKILKNEAKTKANVHFFAGTIEEAKLFLDLGFCFSFTGVITFAREYKEIIKYLPIDRIMSETDAPYVTPIPYRGKRNEPLFVKEIVNKIADIKGLDVEVVKRTLLDNAQKFFSIS